MSEDPIEAMRQVVECIDEGCVPGGGSVTSGWLRMASKDEILDWVWGNLRGRVINALERTKDAISTLNPGNAAATREALKFVAHMDDNGYTSFDVYDAIKRAKHALAAPARNCDRFNTGDVKMDAQHAMEAILKEGVAGYRGIAEYLLSPVKKEEPCTHATDAAI